MFSLHSPWQCGLVSVGLVTRCKEGSAPVSTPWKFLSSAPLPKCCQWKAWQSSAPGGLGVIWPGRGAVECLCALGCFTQRWGRIWEMCPGARCLLSAVCGVFVLLSAWGTRDSLWVSSALLQKSPMPEADMRLDVGISTLDHSNSAALPAAMLMGVPGLTQKQQWNWKYVFLFTGNEYFSRKGLFTAPPSPSPTTATWKHGVCNTWKNNDGLRITRGGESFRGF